MPPKPIVGSSLALVTVALALGTFMQVLDTTITNVSIPAIAGDLAASPNQGTWVITSFAVSNAIMLPITGWLARRVGEVKLFVSATLLFTLASWACGLATNLPMLIFFRILQGAVAGPMIPLSQSLLLANYPNEKKGMALALWSMTVIVAPIFGPILGGWITDNISWPWVFYINIPVGFFSAFLTWQLLKDRESTITRSPIDGVGLVLLIVGVGCLQILLDKGNELGWFSSSFIVGLAVIATVTLSFFIAWELTAEHPVVDLQLFRKRNFAVGAITLSLAYLTFFGNVVVLPLWLQTQMDYTATWAGLAAAPIGLLSLVFSPMVGRNLHRVDLRLFATFSFLVFAGVSFWTSGFSTDIGYFQLFLPRFIQGIGVAFFFVPLSSMSLSDLSPQQLASGAGLSNFLRILAGSFGTSLSISLWEHRGSLHYSQLAEHVTASNPLTTQALDRLHALGASSEGALAILSRTITKQAVMLATDDIFWLSGCIFFALIAVLWFARPPFRAAGAAVAE
ncbi:MAG: DHA2 family efflux MFS transporter permease subunit [Gammaproteobacteria bacterium]|nr:DHA2 family efflux MFS transporter permease subunit [Gammaproteobacteria bacterium]